MIWLAWRQSRAQIVLALGILAGLAALYLTTGPGLARLYNGSGLPSCHAADGCPALVNTFVTQMKADAVYPFLYFFGLGALLLTPPLIGAFWGAPLISRELEGETLRLAWSQSVTRTRWTLLRLAVAGGAGMVFAGLFSLLLTWWAAPIDRAGGFPITGGQLARFAPDAFDVRGVVPVAYAALAFTFGITVGMLIRRTVPAMAVTLAGYAVLQYAVPTWIRPHLFSPDRFTSAPLNVSAFTDYQMDHNGHMALPTDFPGAWIVSDQTVLPTGATFSMPNVPACATGTQQQCTDWLGTQHLRQVVTYQPAGRFWDFQWAEAAGYLAVALILAGFCLWWIRQGRTQG